ncbi:MULTISPECIES: MerR family DNA-binding protein [unclassified Pseudoalteromonas]|uniref:MerR family DNA-binding protein n=1 Tax=unclassified Pseudoalteromonas TaxID=194690 RepID=UPI00332BEAF4|tara:strand:+ start:4428 stop:4631 length:204 start_codon:yes stop_codon:yes gene_type:complete
MCIKRLKFIRAARAAGLLVVDIKPLLMAIDAGERKVPEDIQKLLLTKIEHRKVFLNLVTNQIEEFCN